jgi:hypothetical protein
MSRSRSSPLVGAAEQLEERGLDASSAHRTALLLGALHLDACRDAFGESRTGDKPPRSEPDAWGERLADLDEALPTWLAGALSADEAAKVVEALPTAAADRLAATLKRIPPQTPVRFLGDGHEALQHRADRQARRRSGSYYTPGPIVDRILTLALEDFPADGLLCDPAAGTGHFLLAAAHRLGGRDRASARHAFQTHVRGAERDPTAHAVAGLMLWLALAEPGIVFDPGVHLFCGDALTGPSFEGQPGDPAATPGALDWPATFPQAAARGGFDAVAGNPPYDVLTGFRRRPDLQQYVTALRGSGNFALSLGGQLNLYRLFIERGLHLVRPGGRLSFVVPAGLATDRTAAPLRRALLLEHGLSTLEHRAESVRAFDGAAQAVVVFGAQRDAGSREEVALINRDTAGASSEHRVCPATVVALDPDRLPLPSASRAEWMLAAWLAENATARFDALAEGAVGEVDQTVFRRFMRHDRGALLVRGTHLRPFAADLTPASGPERFLDEEGFLAAKGHVAERVRGAAGAQRIVQLGIRNRDCVRRLVAAIVPGGVYLGNSVNWFAPRGGVPELLVLGLLNSDLLDRRFRFASSNNNINLYEIASLPVPAELIGVLCGDEGDRSRSTRWRERVWSVLTATEQCIEAAGGPGLAQAQRRLDEAVYDLYRVPKRLRPRR